MVFTYNEWKKRATLPNGKVIYNIVLDRTYFKEVNNKFHEGEKVALHGTLYVVESVNILTGLYTVSNCSDGKTESGVEENMITRVRIYWFINSEGCICETFEGKNARADKWRKLSGNMFATKEEAQAKYKSIERQRTN